VGSADVSQLFIFVVFFIVVVHGGGSGCSGNNGRHRLGNCSCRSNLCGSCSCRGKPFTAVRY